MEIKINDTEYNDINYLEHSYDLNCNPCINVGEVNPIRIPINDINNIKIECEENLIIKLNTKHILLSQEFKNITNLEIKRTCFDKLMLNFCYEHKKEFINTYEILLDDLYWFEVYTQE